MTNDQKSSLELKKIKIKTLRNVVSYFHNHMPTSMWSGFMWIHGKYNWMSETCGTVDMEKHSECKYLLMSETCSTVE